MRMITKIGSTAITMFVMLWVAAGPQSAIADDQGAALDCYTHAVDQTLLSKDDAERLCEGADSSGPILCYEEARERTLLPERLAFDLCRCAASTEPVDCYARGKEDTLLDQREIIEMCSPTEQQGLLDNCIPGAYLPSD